MSELKKKILISLLAITIFGGIGLIGNIKLFSGISLINEAFKFAIFPVLLIVFVIWLPGEKSKEIND